VRQYLQAIGMTPEDAAPYVLLLLGGAMPPSLRTTLSPEVVRARTMETFVQLCLHRSRQGSLLLVVEDLHWVDASSHACLAALVDRLAGVPILLLVTARHGYRPSWMDKSYAIQMVLQPLSAPESQTVFQAALGTTALSQALVHAIVQKAEGNPFFLEDSPAWWSSMAVRRPRWRCSRPYRPCSLPVSTAYLRRPSASSISPP
jgi:predicted ATPase